MRSRWWYHLGSQILVHRKRGSTPISCSGCIHTKILLLQHYEEINSLQIHLGHCTVAHTSHRNTEQEETDTVSTATNYWLHMFKQEENFKLGTPFKLQRKNNKTKQKQAVVLSGCMRTESRKTSKPKFFGGFVSFLGCWGFCSCCF